MSQIPGVHEVIGRDGKVGLARKILCGNDMDSGTEHSPDSPFIPIGKNFSSNRTRPFLKIQDGCDAFCTYCIVPYARGPSRSMPMDDVMENIRVLKEAGYKEVVLTGIHLGCYGLDLMPRKNHLVDLLTRIDRSEAIDRVRLSSIEPLELSDAIIRLVAHSKTICRHFHIPLQSGDHDILRRMRRPYTAEQFRDRVLSIRRMMPDAGIGVDVLIGFPGETEIAFENTYRLIQALPITYLHVFPFSPRRGTPASRFSDQVPPDVAKQRARRMRRLGAEKKTAFYESFLGQTVDVLIEGARDSATGYLKGITANYIAVLAQGPDRSKNGFAKIRLEKLNDHRSVFGVIVET